MSADRAVSEVLGYVLVIAIVTMMIGTVMTLGVSGLYASQSAEQTNNMERAFDVLADNLQQMSVGRAPSRATEIRLVEGHIRYGEPVQINVTVDGGTAVNHSIISHPLVYDNEQGTTIVYEAGAILRAQQDHVVMLSEPSFLVTEDHMLFPIVRTRAYTGTVDRVDAMETILVRGDGLQTSTERGSGDEVNITVESPRAEAWESYFEDAELADADISVDGDMVRVEFIGDDVNVSVVRQRIRITLQD